MELSNEACQQEVDEEVPVVVPKGLVAPSSTTTSRREPSITQNVLLDGNDDVKRVEKEGNRFVLTTRDSVGSLYSRSSFGFEDL